MSEKNSHRSTKTKKYARHWDHDLIRDRYSRSEGREPLDCIKQAYRAPLKQDLRKEIAEAIEG